MTRTLLFSPPPPSCPSIVLLPQSAAPLPALMPFPPSPCLQQCERLWRHEKPDLGTVQEEVEPCAGLGPASRHTHYSCSMQAAAHLGHTSPAIIASQGRHATYPSSVPQAQCSTSAGPAGPAGPAAAHLGKQAPQQQDVDRLQVALGLTPVQVAHVLPARTRYPPRSLSQFISWPVNHH
jgi:hypothetical protein